MIVLEIPNKGEFRLALEENNIHKFSLCRFSFKSNSASNEIIISEDYVYTFIDNILGRLNKIPHLNQQQLFGGLGKWQEYYYYDSGFVEDCADEIKQMENATFVSAECYGIFLYKSDDKVWMELDRGYDGKCVLSPYDYYANPSNYRVLLTEIPLTMLYEWQMKLEAVKIKYIENAQA